VEWLYSVKNCSMGCGHWPGPCKTVNNAPHLLTQACAEHTPIGLSFKSTASVGSKIMLITEHAVALNFLIRCISLLSVKSIVVDTRLKLDQRYSKRFQHKKSMPRLTLEEQFTFHRPIVNCCPAHHLSKGRVNRPHFAQTTSIPPPPPPGGKNQCP
jgi:hypothetical protein